VICFYWYNAKVDVTDKKGDRHACFYWYNAKIYMTLLMGQLRMSV